MLLMNLRNFGGTSSQLQYPSEKLVALSKQLVEAGQAMPRRAAYSTRPRGRSITRGCVSAVLALLQLAARRHQGAFAATAPDPALRHQAAGPTTTSNGRVPTT
jgi:hypothetical protein